MDKLMTLDGSLNSQRLQEIINKKSGFSSKELEEVKPEVNQVSAQQVQQGSHNIMEKNFVHSSATTSKYTKSSRAARDATSQQRNRQNAILTSAMIEVQILLNSDKDKNNYAKITLVGQRAANRIRDELQASSFEASKKNLDDIEDDIERRAEEAISNENNDSSIPKNGNVANLQSQPIKQTPTDDTLNSSLSSDTTASTLNDSIPKEEYQEQARDAATVPVVPIVVATEIIMPSESSRLHSTLTPPIDVEV